MTEKTQMPPETQVSNSIVGSERLTPLMRQYWDIKLAHQDKILFFRMGDFFELFHQDAITAAPLLGITLTSRNKKSADETPMCGVPHHSIASPINKLLGHGYKVAICDQIEDPKDAKGIVKRAVTRILTPGMVYDPDSLDGATPNYLAAFSDQRLAFFEPTTGEAFYYDVGWNVQPDVLSRLLDVLKPVEIVLEGESVSHFEGVRRHLSYLPHVTHRQKKSEGRDSAWILPMGLFDYAVEMQGTLLGQLQVQFERRVIDGTMNLGPNTLRHLEVFENYRGEKKGSLLSVLDQTKTSSGARHLRAWFQIPLIEQNKIEARFRKIEIWTEQAHELKAVRAELAGLGDIERRLMKLAQPQANARDLQSLGQSLLLGAQLSTRPVVSKVYSDLKSELGMAEGLGSRIMNQFLDELPMGVRQGGLFRKDLRQDLDELIELTEHAENLLLQMEARERETTGIPSLKIRYNNVFGYYIEVTHTHRDKVPARFQRKQTLVNAERFMTEELSTLEQKILSARVRRNELEHQMFVDLKDEVLRNSGILLRLAFQWSELDVVTTLAWVALENNYVKPQFHSVRKIELMGARHPVVERLVEGPFVSNDIVLDDGACLLLTGPNMAGKSTLMRQVALIALMAQCGSFVPVRQARLPIFSDLLTRIGSSDALWEGLSTFMVEMNETAELLKMSRATSLVILDEVGRGTSTYDGMSLAHAILEELVQNKKCHTFFATHYHELTDIESENHQIQNGHMAIREYENGLSFLYTLKRGPANKSYGIQVAERAGLPRSVIARAQILLKQKEARSRLFQRDTATNQMSLFGDSTL